jgi:hypothetical protein
VEIAGKRFDRGSAAERVDAGHLGEVVHHQIVDGPAFDLPARRGGIVSPEPAAVGDNRPLHLNSSRAITIRCTSDVPSPISHNFASR